MFSGVNATVGGHVRDHSRRHRGRVGRPGGWLGRCDTFDGHCGLELFDSAVVVHHMQGVGCCLSGRDAHEPCPGATGPSIVKAHVAATFHWSVAPCPVATVGGVTVNSDRSGCGSSPPPRRSARQTTKVDT